METSADVSPVDNDVEVAVFVLFGRVVQSPIKLTQDKREFRFDLSFVTFAVRLYFYIVWPSVLSLKNIKLHKT